MLLVPFCRRENGSQRGQRGLPRDVGPQKGLTTVGVPTNERRACRVGGHGLGAAAPEDRGCVSLLRGPEVSAHRASAPRPSAPGSFPLLAPHPCGCCPLWLSSESVIRSQGSERRRV